MKKYPYRIEPFKYQREGMRLIHRQKTVGLFWEMGTGKTKTVLDFIGVMRWNNLIGKTLVICKLRGIAVWEDEIRQNMLPEVSYCVLRNSPRPAHWENSDIFITNYDYARTHRKELKKLAPDVICIDESHRIKNPHARQSRMAHALSPLARYRIALTGTEIGNHVLDLWSQFKFIKPDLLDQKFKEFKDNYSISGGFGGYEIKKYKHMPKLAAKIKPFVSFQHSITGVKSKFIDVPVEMPEAAKKLYKQMEEEFVAWVSKETVISAPIVLAKMMKLSQIAGGFIKDTETKKIHPVHTAKLEALKELTDNLKEQSEPRFVVFARFIWELDQIRDLLANDWATYTIKGGVSVDDQKMCESMFNHGGGAMLCQIDSGSESLNLQSARYEFLYSVNYSAISYWQAVKRIDRTGQKAKTCFFYQLNCRGTIDRRIHSILRQKKSIRDEMRKLVKEMVEGRP